MCLLNSDIIALFLYHINWNIFLTSSLWYGLYRLKYFSQGAVLVHWRDGYLLCKLVAVALTSKELIIFEFFSLVAAKLLDFAPDY